MYGRNSVSKLERNPCEMMELKLIHSLKLWPADNVSSLDSFVEKENDYIYFIEHIDRKGKLRVRNYQVVESWQEADKDRDDSIGKYYNLIEITKFLDEEAMP